MYLLPAIDILDGKAVRLAKGDYSKATIYHEDPVYQAQIFEEAGASWIHVVDLDGARSGVPENIAIIERILANTQLQVEVGGGVRNLDTIARYHEAGVNRVVLGTSLVKDKEFAQAAIETYKDLLAAGIDARAGEVAIAGWQDGSGISTESLVAQVAQMGYKHLIYTDISRDGMQTGIEVAPYVQIAEAFGNPVTASGGVASIDDILRLGEVALSIEGVIAGRAVYEKTLDVAEGVRACEEATRKAVETLANQKPSEGSSLC
ncbi:MAG: 1-(5-phosphoribosyl)-5-[(5-phosphoribosylamino)methylideneamino]imidazole-4-carboxamide isomerase [Raoultibacter sp.]|jgi:phosphoribosylformimino-5-aminoimidazole carboxamide ribotide isomerase